METFFLFVVVISGLVGVFCDTPANCTYEDILGKWTFQFTSLNHDKTLDCSTMGEVESTLNLQLYFPDLAIDEHGNNGFWTLIYNQGFEVVIGGRKHFAFSKYEENRKAVTSICSETLPGWSHGVNGQQWGCFVGKKVAGKIPKRSSMPRLAPDSVLRRQVYKNDLDFINKINAAQKSWRAVAYDQFEGITMETLINMAGGRKSFIASKPKPAPVTYGQIKQVEQLPDEFDWRNVDGVDFVSPIRNQGGCGSCYAFASLAMDEARVRIMTNKSFTPVFSPQDIVECSEYSQGCAGGFPYLIGGKYAEDFGLVEEKCNPYTGKDGKCATDPKCSRHYSTEYEYIGGFYGGCNEPLMRLSLVNNGPIVVGFEVYEDFMNYKSGIYHHNFTLPGALSDFYPFQLTNHAVLIVGYGIEGEQPYWIVKNSWGTSWGEDGYFKIRRGNDECGMESMATESFPTVMMNNQ